MKIEDRICLEEKLSGLLCPKFFTPKKASSQILQFNEDEYCHSRSLHIPFLYKVK